MSRYTGPGGLSVRAPANWRSDPSSGVRSIRDFDAPDSPARLLGRFFRIGIGSTETSGNFETDVRSGAQFLRSTYGAQIINSPRFTTFLGVAAGDIEYRYYNADLRVERHGIERLWQENGVTLIIQSSGPSNEWGRTRSLFSQLLSSAQVA